MTYNPAIPNANDPISQSQSQIKTNFGQADIIFDVNHVTFDNVTATDRGKHRKVEFIRQVADPGSAATQLDLYQKLSGTSSELFFQRDNVASVTQLTGGGITTAAWAQFNGTTATLNEQFNIASVVRNSVGNYTINFTRNFATSNYSALVFPSFNGNGLTVQLTRAVGSLNMLIRNNAVLSDSNDVSVAIFGTLA